MSTGYGLSYHAKKIQFVVLREMWNTPVKLQERKSANAEILNLLVQMIQKSLWLLFYKKSEKNLSMFHCLEFFRAETKCKSQPLHMKQQYFVQMELLQF